MPECKQCVEYAEVLAELQTNYKKIQRELQHYRTLATKYEITLRDNGMIEKTSEVSDVEAICVEQILRLKEKSTIGQFTEGDSKILDILHKNLKSARGEKVEQDGKSKTKKYSDKELLNLIKLEQ